LLSRAIGSSFFLIILSISGFSLLFFGADTSGMDALELRRADCAVGSGLYVYCSQLSHHFVNGNTAPAGSECYVSSLRFEHLIPDFRLFQTKVMTVKCGT